jgi:hypothetical protein
VNVSPPQRSNSPDYRRHTYEAPDAKARLEQVAEALRELFELLESFGPMWYTERHHKAAAAALRLVKKRQKAS